MTTRTKPKTDEKPPEAEQEIKAPVVPEPLVDLDDVAPDRPTVRFQGALYEMATLDDFGIQDQHGLTRDGREFFRLWSSDDELTKSQKQRLTMLLERMFEKVFIAPDEVKAKLSDGKKSQVVLGFTLAPLAQRAAAQQIQTDEEPRNDPPTTGS